MPQPIPKVEKQAVSKDKQEAAARIRAATDILNEAMDEAALKFGLRVELDYHYRGAVGYPFDVPLIITQIWEQV